MLNGYRRIWREFTLRSAVALFWLLPLPGALAQSGGAVAGIYGYTAREGDATGLDYYRARYYASSFGRFTQRDPIGLAAGIDDYPYLGANPVAAGDPSGLDPGGAGRLWDFIVGRSPLLEVTLENAPPGYKGEVLQGALPPPALYFGSVRGVATILRQGLAPDSAVVEVLEAEGLRAWLRGYASIDAATAMVQRLLRFGNLTRGTVTQVSPEFLEGVVRAEPSIWVATAAGGPPLVLIPTELTYLVHSVPLRAVDWVQRVNAFGGRYGSVFMNAARGSR